MAEYPIYTAKDLSDFSGRPEASYQPSGWIPQAVAQATLLFKIATCLNQFPDDPTEAELAGYAIKAMADYAVLNQPYAQAAASPFQSETLGSYSYSKMASSASKGEKTGVMWFDIAVDQIGQCDKNDDVPSGGGIEVFEFDGLFGAALVPGNSARLLSPDDEAYHLAFMVSGPHDPNGLTRN